jgi:hypothetical protein
MSPTKQEYFPLVGGLDQVTSAINIEPGKLIAVSNYEQSILGGYTRIQGFERYDGDGLPSEMSYWLMGFDTGGTVELTADMHIVGQTSGATGIIVSVSLGSGSWAGGDAAGEIVIYRVTGTFQDDESVSFINVDDGFDAGFSGGYA